MNQGRAQVRPQRSQRRRPSVPIRPLVNLLTQRRRPVVVRPQVQRYHYSTPTYTYVAPPVYTAPVPYGYYSDRVIYTSVLHMLSARFPGQIDDFELGVSRGTVAIGGEVRSRRIKYLILQSLFQIPGVRSVNSDLEVDD